MGGIGVLLATKATKVGCNGGSAGTLRLSASEDRIAKTSVRVTMATTMIVPPKFAGGDGDPSSLRI